MASADALNYPYIRVRDVDWLKRTLLIFPRVARVTLARGAPADDPLIEPFTTPRKGEETPLLRPAKLDLPDVQKCLVELRKELEGRLAAPDGDAFRARFDERAAQADCRGSIEEPTGWERRLVPDANFQIHPEKLGEVTKILCKNGLAWKPSPGTADAADYLEMHSVLGEAIVATLATGCAEAEGLQVVTEFPKLHGKLIGTPREKIFSACLDGPEADGKVTGEHILEFIVHRQCDVSQLSMEDIYELHEERKALAEFRRKLEELATTEFKQPVSDPGERDKQIEARLQDLFEDWREEQKQLPPAGRRFFGEGVLTEPRKFIEKIGEALLKPEAGLAGTQGAALAGAPLAAHAAAGGGLTPVLVTAGFGFVVGVVFRGIESWGKAREAAKKSPLGYLTRLDEKGVLRDQGVSFTMSG